MKRLLSPRRKSRMQPSPVARICTACGSETEPCWTTCRICGELLLEATMRDARPSSKPTFTERFNAVANGVNNESRGIWGHEKYTPRDGQPF